MVQVPSTLFDSAAKNAVLASKQEAQDKLEADSPLQFTKELLAELREAGFDWWLKGYREAFPPAVLMASLEQRPDLRGSIVHALVGIKPKTAHSMPLALQAQNIDAVFDSGDINTAEYEAAFAPEDLVVYHDPRAFWQRWRDTMPWGVADEKLQLLMQHVLTTLLKDRISGAILTAHDVRSNIPRAVWRSKIPVKILDRIDEEMLAREASDPLTPFHAKDILEIATPEILAKHIPSNEFLAILDLAERKMGWGRPAAPEPEEAAPSSVRSFDISRNPDGSSHPPPVATPPETSAEKPKPAAHDEATDASAGVADPKS